LVCLYSLLNFRYCRGISSYSEWLVDLLNFRFFQSVMAYRVLRNWFIYSQRLGERCLKCTTMMVFAGGRETRLN
jgi:hypothetical protein